MWSKHGRGGPKTASSIGSAVAELEIAIRLHIAPPIRRILRVPHYSVVQDDRENMASA
jgi:hypothetical protein